MRTEGTLKDALKQVKSLMQLKNATETLLQRVPAFAEARSSNTESMSHDDDSPYIV